MKSKSMKITLSKLLASILFLLLLFGGCDPATSDEYFINNESDQIAVIELNYDFDNKTSIDTFIYIQPHTESMIYESSPYTDCPKDMGDSFLNYFKNLDIYINDTSFVDKEIHLRENWTYNENSGSGCNCGGHSEYHYVFTNEDVKILNNK